ncbi:hypothetical protein [Janthinobacterium sp. B9-8]|uniref:hypothetical protein n=1 Tax=Janthinobacterium sp. B9-8 TaxID=1236179 RepID=UPI00061D1A33|nr:hypothetical protein [Janthinobacterium sp. B9-8]AMC34110.1 hypothetical protein VN23_05620 [Janthinobacterium sp. B9-8]
MPLSQLLSSFAAAFNQDQRLISLQLGDGGARGEQLLPQRVRAARGLIRLAAIRSIAYPPMVL